MQLLKAEIQIFEFIRQRLIEHHPDLDDETIRDTLEGCTNLHELIGEAVRSALLDEALQIGLRARLADMKLRLARIEERSIKKRQLALQAMTEVGIGKLEHADFTASVRLGSPTLVVTSEEAIPSAYWVPQAPKLDRQGLTADLKRGIEVTGACLGNKNPILVVRTK